MAKPTYQQILKSVKDESPEMKHKKAQQVAKERYDSMKNDTESQDLPSDASLQAPVKNHSLDKIKAAKFDIIRKQRFILTKNDLTIALGKVGLRNCQYKTVKDEGRNIVVKIITEDGFEFPDGGVKIIK